MNKTWSPLEELRQKIISQGGMVNSHAHFDRAYTVNPTNMNLTKNHLHQKWELVDKFKKNATVEDYIFNIESAVKKQIEFNTQAALTFIDIDEICGDKALQAALYVKEKYKNKFKLRIACQTLKGVFEKKSREILEKHLHSVDVIGSLPAKDLGREVEHLDTVMNWAKQYNKRVHVHVDQLNDPSEKETELLCRKTIEHGLESRVTAVHSISLACHPKDYRNKVYELARDSDLSFVACPSAWIDHQRSEKLMPFHNALTPVDELLEKNLLVAIGTDNICDIYKPYCDGNLFNEIRLIIDGCKIYDEKSLIDMSIYNGLKIIE